MSKEVDQLLNEVDNYVQTVGAIIALGHMIVYDFGGNVRIGPSLKTSDKNPIPECRNIEITPDLAGQSTDLNIVGEVKKSFPDDNALWVKHTKQIMKYDDELSNWPKADVKIHDIVLLTHYLRSIKVKEYIEERIAAKDLTFTRELSIVEFIRNSERRTFWNLRKIYGKLSNQVLDDKLREGRGVPAELIVKELSSVKFYDAEPPIVYTMSLLWDFVFSDKATPQKFRESGGRKTIEIPFTVDEAHKQLKAFFAPEGSSFPKRPWVEKAMKAFEKIGLAYRREDGGYVIAYHRIEHGRSLDHFAEKWIDKQKDLKLTDIFEEVAKKPTSK